MTNVTFTDIALNFLQIDFDGSLKLFKLTFYPFGRRLKIKMSQDSDIFDLYQMDLFNSETQENLNVLDVLLNELNQTSAMHVSRSMPITPSECIIRQKEFASSITGNEKAV